MRSRTSESVDSAPAVSNGTAKRRRKDEAALQHVARLAEVALALGQATTDVERPGLRLIGLGNGRIFRAARISFRPSVA